MSKIRRDYKRDTVELQKDYNVVTRMTKGLQKRIHHGLPSSAWIFTVENQRVPVHAKLCNLW